MGKRIPKSGQEFVSFAWKLVFTNRHFSRPVKICGSNRLMCFRVWPHTQTHIGAFFSRRLLVDREPINFVYDPAYCFQLCWLWLHRVELPVRRLKALPRLVVDCLSPPSSSRGEQNYKWPNWRRLHAALALRLSINGLNCSLGGLMTANKVVATINGALMWLNFHEFSHKQLDTVERERERGGTLQET